MTTHPATTAPAPAKERRSPAGVSSISRFQVRVEPAADGREYGLTLEETNRPSGHPRTVAHIPPRRRPALMWPLNDALRTSRHASGTLHPGRRKPIGLDDAAGVRLALACYATAGITKPGRATALLDALSRLADEECFYWYAHTQWGDQHARHRKLRALRTFLAD
jgi:hypothetical protein